MTTTEEWGNSRREQGVLVRVFGVGLEEGKEPREAGKPAEDRTNYFAPIPVWDPREGRAVFPKAPLVCANEAERQAEARIAERIRNAFPAKRGANRRSGKQKARKADAGLMNLSDGEVFDLGAFEREMERRKLNLNEFRGAVRAGGFKAVHLVAQGPVFVIQGEPQGKPVKGRLGVAEEARMTLVTINDRKEHTFPNPTSALGLLKRLGVKRLEIDIESWRPDLPTQRGRRRPDMVERLKFAHEYVQGGEGEKI